MSSSELLELKRNIDKFGKKEHVYILRILKEHNVEMSENSESTFVNMKVIPEECLKEIRDFVCICLQNLEVDKDRAKEYDLSLCTNEAEVGT